jgi:sporulation protein YlmC with PRC-barrel domain
MRKSLLSASVTSFVFALGAAYAQEKSIHTETATEEAASPAMETAQLEGQNVFDANGQPVGTVETVITADDGSQQAILSVGGFLGLGAKKISVGVDELQENADGSGYTLSMTAEEVEAAPAFQGEVEAEQPVNE